ncbi:MAG: LuxR C-terminal-related transcriptional regulator, partial [Acidimicrobiia bacterium]
PKLRPAVAAAWMFPTLFGDVGGDEIDRLLNLGRGALASMTEEEEAADAHLWGLVPYLFREDPDELIRGIDATIAHRTGDFDLAVETLAAQGPEPSESGWVEGAAGEMLIFHEQYSDGLKLAEQWHNYCFSPLNPILGNQAYALATQALASLGSGDLAAAEALSTRAGDLMRDSGFADALQSAVAAVPRAWAAWERGDVDTAEAHIIEAIDLLDRLGEVPPGVLGRVVLARALAYRGKMEEAKQVLNRASLSSAGSVVVGYFADRIALERARLSLLSGDVVGAEVALPDWRERIDEGAATMTEHLILARMAIAAGEEAEAMLVAPDERFEITTAHRLELHKLRAHLAVREGDNAVALDELTAAMRIAAHTGHVQTFLDDAPVFGALLANAAALSGHRLRADVAIAASVAAGDSAAALVEPLTERELETLRLLPSHLTYQGMAETLFVSPNTIKAYIKTIYRKLDADRRSEAVDNARILGLID